jgi:hypothetical protein
MLKRITIAAVLAFAFVGGGLLVDFLRPPLSNPHFEAQTFLWPAGCSQKRYVWTDDIPKACKVERNAISVELTRSHGFDPGPKGDSRFFRVGNDAVAFSCPPWGRTCRIRRIYYDVFVVEPA